MAEFGAVLTLLALALLLALAIAWLLVPVMLAGVRSGVRELVSQQARTNELLQAMLQGKQAAPPRAASPPAPPRDTLLDRRYPPP